MGKMSFSSLKIVHFNVETAKCFLSRAKAHAT